MELEIVNKLFLELSQITTAKTKREIELEDEIIKYKPYFDAIDEEAVVTWTLDSSLSAKEQLMKIIDWHVQVTTDPTVNGGYKLVKIEDNKNEQS